MADSQRNQCGTTSRTAENESARAALQRRFREGPRGRSPFHRREKESDRLAPAIMTERNRGNY